MKQPVLFRWPILWLVLLGSVIATGCQTTCDEYTTDWSEAAVASGDRLAYQSDHPCGPSARFESRDR